MIDGMLVRQLCGEIEYAIAQDNTINYPVTPSLNDDFLGGSQEEGRRDMKEGRTDRRKERRRESAKAENRNKRSVM